MNRIDLDQLQRVLTAPDPQERLAESAEDDLRPLLRSLVIKALLLATLTGRWPPPSCPAAACTTMRDGTRFLTVGSAGATGLGTFTIEGGRAYEAEVLSFVQGRLAAVDYVSFKGIAGSFRVDRVVVPPDEEAASPGGDGLQGAP